jgi:hypothetical protein
MKRYPRPVALPVSAVEQAQDRAAELANDLAQLAKERDDGQLARLATDALKVVAYFHNIAEAFASGWRR